MSYLFGDNRVLDTVISMLPTAYTGIVCYFVTLQDYSPPSVIHGMFVAAGFAAAGCKARSNKHEQPQAARNQVTE